MCEFSNKLVTSGRKFQNMNHFWKINEKVFFWENSSEKRFVWKNPRWNFSFFQKISWKTCFLPRKRIEKRVTRKFDESLAKVSLKLSVAIRKFQRNFRWPYESFMKLSVARWKFHETFGGQMKVSWNFRQTFVKLLHESFFDAFFRQKNHVFQLVFLKKMRNFTLDFNTKKVFAWIFFKKSLFPRFVQTMFSFLLKLFSPRS